jgi:hypothetical protein
MHANYGAGCRSPRARPAGTCDIPSVWLMILLTDDPAVMSPFFQPSQWQSQQGVHRGPKPCRRRCSRKRRKEAVAHCGLLANSSLRLARAERPCRYGSRYNDVHGSKIVNPEVMIIVEAVRGTDQS